MLRHCSAVRRRGHNKAGRHQLRQIGLGLLACRQSGLPLHYKVYRNVSTTLRHP